MPATAPDAATATSLPPVADETPESDAAFRLSPQQVRAVAVARRIGGTGTRGLMRIAGSDARQIRRAVGAVAERHEILRTRLQWQPGLRLPLQVIDPPAPPVVETWDGSGGIAGLVARIEDAAAVDAAAWSLARLADGAHALGVRLPAWCADAASLALLVDELAAHLAHAGDPEQEEEAVQYADAAEIFHELLEADDTGAGRDFWRPLLEAGEAAQAGAELPWQRRLDTPRHGAQPAAEETAAEEPAPHRLVHPLDADLWRRLGAAAGGDAEVRSAWLLAAWQVLLARLAGAGRDAAAPGVAYPFAGRTHDGLQSALGPYERFLPVDVRLDPGIAFRDAVETILRRLNELARWQDYFPVQRFPVRRFPVRRPPGEAGGDGGVRGAAFAERPRHRAGSGDLELELLHQHCAADRFRLLLEVHHDGGAVGQGAAELSLLYNPLIWRREDAGRLVAAYVRLLAHSVAEPRCPVRNLPLISPQEHRQLVAETQRSDRTWQGSALLHQLVGEAAAGQPRAPALVSDRGTLSYDETWHRALLLATVLRRRGAAPGRVVALALPPETERVIALLAILQTGATLLPVDPDWPPPRFASVAEQAAPHLAVVATRQIPHCPNVLLEELAAEAAAVTAEDRQATAAAALRIPPESAAYVLFTSGSTGRPKGVAVSHRAVVNHLRWRQEVHPLAGGDRFLHKAALTFDIALWELFAPLSAGAAAVLPPAGSGGDPAALVDVMARHRVTVAHCGPALLTNLLEAPDVDRLHLRSVFCGGESLSRRLARRFHERLPAARLHHQYGPTETTVDVTVHTVTAEDLAAGDDGEALPLGSPVANTRVYLLDDDLQPVPAGVRGEIFVAGDCLARGYLGQPARTAESFLPDPLATAGGGRLYRTGDLGRRDDLGHLRFRGRRDEQVKVRGFRIESGEVAAALSAHPAVRRAAVAVHGEEPAQRRLVAYLETVPGAEPGTPGVDELHDFLAARLPEYMLPALFVAMDELPVNRHGKVDRHRLPAPHHGNTLRPGSGYAPPSTPREEILCQIWSRVLQVPRIGVDDNYFHLGGDSIRIINVSYEAHEAGLPVSAQDLIRHQTVRSLAAALDGGGGAGRRPPRLELATPAPALRVALAAEDCVDVYPATPLQELMFRHTAAAAPGHGVYHVQSCVSLSGAAADPEALRRALGEVVAAHAPLRTRFLRGADGSLLQGVRRDPTPALALHDLRHLMAAERRAFVETTIRADLARPYAVGDPGVPQRFHLFVEADDALSLLMSNHHAIRDGWGRVVLLNRLLERTTELRAGGDRRGAGAAGDGTRLDAYKELVALQREIAASPAARRFWQDWDIPPAPPLTPLRPASSGPPAPVVDRLPDGLARRLLRRAGELGVTPRALFLAAYLELVTELTGGPGATVALVCNGRSERLSDPLGSIGLYWNLLPFHLRRDAVTRAAAPSFGAEAVQRRLFDVEPYALYPLPELLPGLGGEEALFASFNYTQFHHERRSFGDGLRLTETHFHDRFHFPLNCVLSVKPLHARDVTPDDATPGDASVRFEYDDRYFTGHQVTRLSHRYRELLATAAGEDRAPTRRPESTLPAAEAAPRRDATAARPTP